MYFLFMVYSSLFCWWPSVVLGGIDCLFIRCWITMATKAFIEFALDSLSNILDKGSMSCFNLTWHISCDLWSLVIFAIFSITLICLLVFSLSNWLWVVRARFVFVHTTVVVVPISGCHRHSCVSPVTSVVAAVVVFGFFGLGPLYWL
jgi:hypothetical protein